MHTLVHLLSPIQCSFGNLLSGKCYISYLIDLQDHVFWHILTYVGYPSSAFASYHRSWNCRPFPYCSGTWPPPPATMKATVRHLTSSLKAIEVVHVVMALWCIEGVGFQAMEQKLEEGGDAETAQDSSESLSTSQRLSLVCTQKLPQQITPTIVLKLKNTRRVC